MNDQQCSHKTMQRPDDCGLGLHLAECEIGLKQAFSSEPLDTGGPAVSWLANSEASGSRILHKQPSILVVEDESPIRLLIGSTLERWGYRVHLASGGNEARQAIDRDAFDLILTDVMMQDGDGLTLLDWVHSKQPDLPVVIVSAASDIGMAIDSMHRGACDYLLKPFDHRKLFETIRRALEQRLEILEARAYQHNLKQELRIRTDMLRWAVDDLQRTHDLMLLTLSDALDLRDSETEGHSKRVTAYSIALARALKISPLEIKVLAQGALLHDVGKIAVPDAILRKPGKLTKEEQEIMRTHCMRGHEMLCRIPFLADASEIVLAHHEHFDGSGYPRGLGGSGIPFGARIFAVADSLDAITSNRPYHNAQTFNAAREEIQTRSGAQFDPDVVEAFTKVPCDVWSTLRAETIGGERDHSVLREVLSNLPDLSGLQDLIAMSFSDAQAPVVA
jgi:putative nucleotidyltransferase with HDIG domain